MNRRLSWLVASLLVGAALSDTRADTLTYTLSPSGENGGIRVELTWETQNRTYPVAGVSPRWGSVSDVPAMLSDVSISGANSSRRDGAKWIIEHRKGATLTFQYDVRSKHRDFDWDSTHYPIATRQLFHGIGNAFLLVPEAGGDVPREYEAMLRWKIPQNWKAVCSWGVGRSVAGKIDAGDLRHSVYVAGELILKNVERDGRSVTVALPDKFGFAPDEFLKMADTIIGQQCDYMADRDFPPFVVTAIPVGEPLKEGDSRLSGTGLYRSFALFIAPQAKINDAVEHLFAHELFHYWNGRTLEAADPEQLVYWFTEGFTDNFALKILFASEQWNAALYAKWLNKHMREYQNNPARNATNDEIKAGFWTKRDTVGEVAYQRGLLLGLRWDKLARDAGVKDGVDRLFRALLDRARTGSFKLTNDGIRSTGADQLGKWFTAEFDRFVTKADTIEVPADALSPRLPGRVETVYEYALGFDRDKSLKQKSVVGLVSGSAAEKAGLRESDELAGWSIYADTDKKTELKVRRGDKIKTIAFYPRGKGRQMLQFRAGD